MIDVYTWPTPNGHKVHLMLEELGLPYRVIAVDIGNGEQFKPEFLKISPQNKIPAIVDHDGPGGKPMSLFETGAILIYLAEKTKSALLPASGPARYETLAWLMFQVGHIGPMFGQANHFIRVAPERLPYPTERYVNEAGRLWGVLDKRLQTSPYIAGETYTIADIATFPWIRLHRGQNQNIENFPNVKRWMDMIYARPATARALDVLKADRTDYSKPMDPAKREILYGKAQYERR
ncbi:MAG: glutathione S-transferase N-terminal domain-containing protein [Alphaproteobacteria bacterium]